MIRLDLPDPREQCPRQLTGRVHRGGRRPRLLVGGQHDRRDHRTRGPGRLRHHSTSERHGRRQPTADRGQRGHRDHLRPRGHRLRPRCDGPAGRANRCRSDRPGSTDRWDAPRGGLVTVVPGAARRGRGNRERCSRDPRLPSRRGRGQRTTSGQAHRDAEHTRGHPPPRHRLRHPPSSIPGPWPARHHTVINPSPQRDRRPDGRSTTRPTGHHRCALRSRTVRNSCFSTT